MLSKIPDWLWAVLVCAAIYGTGIWRGVEAMTEKYESQIAAAHAAHAEQDRARAEAVAAAEKNARERLAAEKERGNKLANELLSKTKQLDVERASVNKRIRDVSEAARRDCAGLSADWVRLYNEALGLAGSGRSARGEDYTPGATDGAAASAGTAHTGIQPDALATPEDVLAHVRDYGGYCRKLEAGYGALIDYGATNERH